MASLGKTASALVFRFRGPNYALRCVAPENHFTITNRFGWNRKAPGACGLTKTNQGNKHWESRLRKMARSETRRRQLRQGNKHWESRLLVRKVSLSSI